MPPAEREVKQIHNKMDINIFDIFRTHPEYENLTEEEMPLAFTPDAIELMKEKRRRPDARLFRFAMMYSHAEARFESIRSNEPVDPQVEKDANEFLCELINTLTPNCFIDWLDKFIEKSNGILGDRDPIYIINAYQDEYGSPFVSIRKNDFDKFMDNFQSQSDLIDESPIDNEDYLS